MTVRDIPDDAKQRFRQIAAAHGRSMEEQLRQMIINAGFDDNPAETKGVRDVTAPFRHLKTPETPARAASRARIERLIELGRGLDWEPPKREVGTIKDLDFS